MKINVHVAHRRALGMTLVEYLVAAGLAGIVLMAVIPLSIYSAFNFATLANFSELNTASVQALDRITTEIRQSVRLQSFASNQVTLDMGTNQPALTYSFSPITQTLTRRENNDVKVILRGVTDLEFAMFRRNPKPGAFEHYGTTNVNDCKVLTLKWTSERTLMGSRVNSETMQAARIVIRKN